MSQPLVFISYARVDGAEVAARIHRDLSERGVLSWLDVESIPAGSDWDDEIDRALASAISVVVVVTPGANASRQVKSEWNYALSANTPVLPIVVGECTLPRVLAMLEALNYDSGSAGALQRLYDRLQSIGTDHLHYLGGMREQLLQARATSSTPARFDTRLATISSAIDQLAGRDQPRWADASMEHLLRHERQIVASMSASHDALDHQRISGQRLPATVTEFRDRVPQRRRVCELLNDPSCTLVSVLGRGGIGKSGLVSLILSDLEEGKWHDTGLPADVGGIAYLSTRTGGITLRRILDDVITLLPKASRDRIAASVTGPDELAEVELMLEEIKGDPIILLLDNFEDLQADDGSVIEKSLLSFFERVANRRHRLKLLITSRTPLALPAGLQGWDHQVEVTDGLPEEDAIAMLRALDVNQHTSVAESSDSELAALSQSLHGIPRALEVATSLLMNDPFLTTRELASDFYQQSEVLESLVAENLRRLDAEARAVVECLAVFQGPMPLVAIEYLVQALHPMIDPRATVQRLVRSHTFSLERASKRISLHPVDRDCALARVRSVDPERERELHHHAARYYRHLRLDPSEWRNAASIEPQIQEFHHLCAAHEETDAFELIESIDQGYLNVWGHFPRILSMRSRLHDLTVTQTARNEDGLAYACYALGMYELALEHAQAARQAAHDTGDAALESEALANMGRALRYLERNPEATEAHELGASLAAEAGLARLEGIHLGNLARILDTEDRPDLALRHYHSALQLAERIGDKRGQTYRLGYQGYARFRLGELEVGTAMIHQAVALCEQIGYSRGLAIHLTNLARCEHLNGHEANALDSARQGLEVNRSIGSASGQAASLLLLAELSDSPEIQEQHVEEALGILSRSDDRVAMGPLLLHRARLDQAQGRHGEVIQVLGTLLNGVTSMQTLRMSTTLALSEAALGRSQAAITRLENATKWCSENLLPDDRRFLLLLDAAHAFLALAQADPSDTEAETQGQQLLVRSQELCPAPGFQSLVDGVLIGLGFS